MNRYAVIDLGTNTFHLLAIEQDNNGKIKILHKQRIFVKLAIGGIDTIIDASIQRALNAIGVFKEILLDLNIQNVKALGTAALRTASNGQTLANTILDEYGINVDIISGKEEAKLIHKGVMYTIEAFEKKMLIMDIGGGSVEFIIADNKQVFWAESFPIGIAVLSRQFHENDPIQEDELVALEQYLDKTLEPLHKELQRQGVDSLVGASGTFDVLETNLAEPRISKYSAEVEVQKFRRFYEQVVSTSFEERAQMNIPKERLDMIVIALQLIYYILNKIDVEKIIISDYAMKEGILMEMIEGNLQKWQQL